MTLLASAIKRCELVPPGIERILVTNWSPTIQYIHDNSKPFIFSAINGVDEWYDLEHRGSNLSVRKQDGKNGDLYLEQLDVIIPGIDFNKTENADKLSKGRFVFMGRTKYGSNQLLGTNRPMRMRSFESVASDNENLYRISFSAFNTQMAPYLLDDFVKAIGAPSYSTGFSSGFKK